MNGGDHMHGMSMPPSSNGTMNMTRHRHMMMHMTFFWGKNTEILFHGWPGYDNLGMYVLALFVIFFLAVFVEWLSHCKILSDADHWSVGLLQTIMHAVRVGLAYMVMLAVMSFNGGVFIVAVLGHGVGFFFFGSRAFNKKKGDLGKNSDLPAMSC